MDRERIMFIKGVINLLGLLILIAAVITLYKYGHTLKECYYIHPNGSQERTGLYGNCRWINDKLYMEEVEWTSNNYSLLELPSP